MEIRNQGGRHSALTWTICIIHLKFVLDAILLSILVFDDILCKMSPWFVIFIWQCQFAANYWSNGDSGFEWLESVQPREVGWRSRRSTSIQTIVLDTRVIKKISESVESKWVELPVGWDYVNTAHLVWGLNAYMQSFNDFMVLLPTHLWLQQIPFSTYCSLKLHRNV